MGRHREGKGEREREGKREAGRRGQGEKPHWFKRRGRSRSQLGCGVRKNSRTLVASHIPADLIGTSREMECTVLRLT